MTFDVRWGAEVARRTAELFGLDRSAEGWPSVSDFVAGALAAAVVGFRSFDELPMAAGPSVRSLHVLDPVLGAVVFVGVLVDEDVVEMAAVEIEPDY